MVYGPFFDPADMEGYRQDEPEAKKQRLE